MLARPGNSKIIVGYDLGNAFSQISFYSAETSEVETVSSVAGDEVYSIPTVLCKRFDTNQWLYGKEALKAAADGEGVLVENLLDLALDGEPIHVEGTVYEPVALLSLFIKRSLGLFSTVGSIDRIGALMVTCERMDHRLVEVLGLALGRVKLRARHICFQSYEDSFYHFMLHQPSELFLYQAVLCWYAADRIKVYRMQCNRRATPVAVYTGQEEFPFLSTDGMPETEQLQKERMERMDRELLGRMKEICDNKMISSVYMIGDGFQEEWMGETLKYLCRGRRVFLGSNLFSKGACLGMMERLSPSNAGKTHVLLGHDKLKTNIGMRLNRKGEASYYALLDAGINWYDAQSGHEFYMKNTDFFDLVLTPLDGKRGHVARITLDGLEFPISRMLLKIHMPAQDLVEVTVEDLGFGEFREASHQIWREELPLHYDGKE